MIRHYLNKIIPKKQIKSDVYPWLFPNITSTSEQLFYVFVEGIEAPSIPFMLLQANTNQNYVGDRSILLKTL